jgi:hypothetical protein
MVKSMRERAARKVRECRGTLKTANKILSLPLEESK